MRTRRGPGGIPTAMYTLRLRIGRSSPRLAGLSIARDRGLAAVAASAAGDHSLPRLVARLQRLTGMGTSPLGDLRWSCVVVGVSDEQRYQSNVGDAGPLKALLALGKPVKVCGANTLALVAARHVGESFELDCALVVHSATDHSRDARITA